VRGGPHIGLISTLAGMDIPRLSTTSLPTIAPGKRLWGVMGAMAKVLSAKDWADVRGLFRGAPGRVAGPLTATACSGGGRTLRESNPAIYAWLFSAGRIRHAASRP